MTVKRNLGGGDEEEGLNCRSEVSTLEERAC